ncbi:MAG: tetratricopeptide repeat protein [Candidatus Aminicenantaceae bacterium]
MLKRIFSGLAVLSLCIGLPLEAQREKKVYELIYQDIQAIKQQLLELNQRAQQNSDDIQTLAQQLAEVLRLSRDSRMEIARFQAEQKDLPAQYRILLQRYDGIRAELARITEMLIEIQHATPLPTESGEAQEQSEQPSPEQDAAAQTGGTEGAGDPEDTPQTTLPPNLSPQEVYTMARSDYLKGNFLLAIEGFSMYQEHFDDSPLVDNALYWIGECYFSQENYEDAITRFNDLILGYPDSDKIPAAYLKKGIGLSLLGKTDEALAVLKLMVSKFPLEEEANIAQQKIQELEKRE